MDGLLQYASPKHQVEDPEISSSLLVSNQFKGNRQQLLQEEDAVTINSLRNNSNLHSNSLQQQRFNLWPQPQEEDADVTLT